MKTHAARLTWIAAMVFISLTVACGAAVSRVEDQQAKTTGVKSELDSREPDVLSENLVEINRQNQIFRDQYPEIVGDSEPRECKPGDLWFTCSEVYAHRFDPRLQAHYGESGYIESVLQCGNQTDYRKNDGKHPDGEQVFIVLDCETGEQIPYTPGPTSSTP
jgi:hypothetical protein